MLFPSKGSIIKIECLGELIVCGRVVMEDSKSYLIDIGKPPISFPELKHLTGGKTLEMLYYIEVDRRTGLCSLTDRGYVLEMQQALWYKAIRC